MRGINDKQKLPVRTNKRKGTMLFGMGLRGLLFEENKARQSPGVWVGK